MWSIIGAFVNPAISNVAFIHRRSFLPLLRSYPIVENVPNPASLTPVLKPRPTQFLLSLVRIYFLDYN